MIIKYDSNRPGLYSWWRGMPRALQVSLNVMVTTGAVEMVVVIITSKWRIQASLCNELYWSTIADVRGVVESVDLDLLYPVITVRTDDSVFKHIPRNTGLHRVVKPGDSIIKPAGSLRCTVRTTDTVFTEWYYAPDLCDSSAAR